MKLVDNRNGIQVYDLENGYQVAKEPCPWIPRGYKFSFYPDRTVRSDSSGRYLPDIYDYGESAFRIQTTGCGPLPPEEIQKMITGFQTALNAIRMVEETFMGKK